MNNTVTNYKCNQNIGIWLLIIICFACQDSEKPQSDEIDISTPLDSLIVVLIENEELIGAALNIYQGEVNTFRKVYGWSDLKKERKIRENDIWAIKSMTKPITATAILMLQDDGLLSLDVSISGKKNNNSFYDTYAGWRSQ